MKVIAVRNPLLHPYAFHQVSISRELESRSLVVRYRLARTGHSEEDPVFDVEEQEVLVNLAALRNRPDWCDHLRLSAPSTIAADGQATITIQLEDAAEQPIERQATVYLEAVSGVLPRARVTTTQGTAAVPVFATGLSPGEQVRIKAGWKYFPGVDDITLEVV